MRYKHVRLFVCLPACPPVCLTDLFLPMVEQAEGVVVPEILELVGDDPNMASGRAQGVEIRGGGGGSIKNAVRWRNTLLF